MACSTHSLKPNFMLLFWMSLAKGKLIKINGINKSQAMKKGKIILLKRFNAKAFKLWLLFNRKNEKKPDIKKKTFMLELWIINTTMSGKRSLVLPKLKGHIPVVKTMNGTKTCKTTFNIEAVTRVLSKVSILCWSN